LIITVLAAFSSVLLNDNAKLAGQLAAAESDLDRASEKLTVTRYPDLSEEGKNLRILVSNNGQIPAAYQYVLLYCVTELGCPTSPGVPLINPLSIEPAPPTTLAPGESREIQVGPVADGLSYRIDVITERGNIASTVECRVDLTKKTCQNSSEVVEIQ
jgi:hypothetical protein